MASLLILRVTSILPLIRASTALPGVALAMVILGVASGGLGSNMSQFMAEQYTRRKAVI
jgi:dipeptide/tripeptide permease